MRFGGENERNMDIQGWVKKDNVPFLALGKQL